jgi:galacturan 1,4-alpha-galacturonidase
MYCDGSHGISIGSLGQYASETDNVYNVVAHNVTMLNAQNGARIKVRLLWPRRRAQTERAKKC